MRHTPSLISHLQVVISFRVCLTFILLFLLPDSAPSSLAEPGLAGLGVMSMNDLRDPPSLDSDMMSPSDDAIPLSGQARPATTKHSSTTLTFLPARPGPVLL